MLPLFSDLSNRKRRQRRGSTSNPCHCKQPEVPKDVLYAQDWVQRQAIVPRIAKMGFENVRRMGSGISVGFIQKTSMHSNVGTHINKYIITTIGQPLLFANRNYFFLFTKNITKALS
jgi:hypothetical protein